MKEFVEKLIEKLNEAGGLDASDEYGNGWDEAINEAIDIVERVTEEYKTTYIEELIKAKRFCANDCNTDKCPFGLGEGKCFLDELQAKLETKEQHNDQDLMIVASLPSVYSLQPFEVEAIDRVVSSAKDNNDFCEWHKVKNGNAYKCNTHAEIHDSRVLDWCVCPYCGKKIKVVE